MRSDVGGIRQSSASPRPPCDGTTPASIWPSPRRGLKPGKLYWGLRVVMGFVILRFECCDGIRYTGVCVL